MIHCDMPGCTSEFDGTFAAATSTARWIKRGQLTVCPDCAAVKLESPAHEIARLRKCVAELETDNARLNRIIDDREKQIDAMLRKSME